MTMPIRSPSSGSRHPSALGSPTLRVLLACLLGVVAALLVSCGSNSSAGLIPAGNAGPLQSDFEAVAQAAQTGDGSCSATEAAILKTEQDFGALPASIDSGLRNTLHQGIANLRSRALVLCAQPLAQATSTNTSPKTTTTTTPTTTPTVTQTTTTPTTPTTPPPTTPGPGGGTPAPGAGETPPGAGNGQGGGTGAGESGAGAGGDNGAGDGNGHGNGDGANGGPGEAGGGAQEGPK
jgi:hypothetical protein